MRHFKTFHLAWGVIGLMAFVLTGQYMAIFLRGLADMADGPRLLYRSAHLYLMWSALLNLVVGKYFVVADTHGRRSAQLIGSVLLLLGLPLILTGFFVESPSGSLDRWYCGLANYFALAGTLLHVLTSKAPTETRQVD